MKEAYYDDIPLEYIGKNILEIGVHPRIRKSKIWSKITQGKYTGIDIVIREPDKLKGLNLIQADILEYDLTEKYDTIILIEVMEHIHFGKWKELLQKFRDALDIGGYLILSTPYKQTPLNYVSYPENMGVDDNYQFHTVFSIEEKLWNYFLPNCETKRIKSYWWRQDNAPLIHATQRFIHRLIFGLSPIKRNILVCWQKEG